MKITTFPKRPTMASARAEKHMEQARECARMVRFYDEIDDEVNAEYWREVLAQKVADADQITEDVWRHYK